MIKIGHINGSRLQELLLKKDNEAQHEHKEHWLKTMCLTGVDYYSTLGYQPGIAALAAGALAPIATIVLVLVTLLCALPVYWKVAEASPHGAGSISIVEKLFHWWPAVLAMLVLAGFGLTDYFITITLSAADSAAHLNANPYLPSFLHGHIVFIALALIALLGGIFMKGFKEAIIIATVLVTWFLASYAIIIAVGAYTIITHPHYFSDWTRALYQTHGTNIPLMIWLAILVFPRLALGLSGFETGVVVMPLIKGEKNDTEENPVGRIRNTRKLLLTAAIIMSFFLITSSFVTTLLIPQEAFVDPSTVNIAALTKQIGHAPDMAVLGKANGRALAYLAYELLGPAFGTNIDLCTIALLWFAGASAMAGILNLIPRYLPRYGMAPEWANSTRPLVLIIMAICTIITIKFRASVDAQGGAYATGVLVLMSSGSIGVMIREWIKLLVHKMGNIKTAVAFVFITLIFIYTTIANVQERPDGVRIASIFIITIIVTSIVSRLIRRNEIRHDNVVVTPEAEAIIMNAITIDEETGNKKIRFISLRPNGFTEESLQHKYIETTKGHRIPKNASVPFISMYLRDSSEFKKNELVLKGKFIGKYAVLYADTPAAANAIAAVAIHLAKTYGVKIVHLNYQWTHGNPVLVDIKHLIFGSGDTANKVEQLLFETKKKDDELSDVTFLVHAV